MPIRYGEFLEPNDEFPFPAIVEPEIFFALLSKFKSNNSKPRGRFNKSAPYPLQGILFSMCQNEFIRPVHCETYPSSSDPQLTNTVLKCSCGDEEVDRGVCFYVNSNVIGEPVTEYILTQLSFPDVLDEVRHTLEEDYGQSKARAEAYAKESRKLGSEITNFLRNLGGMELDDESKKVVEQEIARRRTDLKALETKAMQAYSDLKISDEEADFLLEFLSNISSEWHNLPSTFQSRLFQLILTKIVIRLDGEDFLTDIYWKTGLVDTLWIERPLHCAPRRKKWMEAEIELLRQLYPETPQEEIMSRLTGRSWDTIRTRANKLGLLRSIHEGGLEWTEEEDDMLLAFAEGRMTYKEIRRALCHHRQIYVQRRMKKLGLDMPDITRINWRIVNISENAEYSPGRSAAYSPGPSKRR